MHGLAEPTRCLSKLLDAAKFAKLVCMLPEQSRGLVWIG